MRALARAGREREREKKKEEDSFLTTHERESLTPGRGGGGDQKTVEYNSFPTVACRLGTLAVNIIHVARDRNTDMNNPHFVLTFWAGCTKRLYVSRRMTVSWAFRSFDRNSRHRRDIDVPTCAAGCICTSCICCMRACTKVVYHGVLTGANPLEERAM